MTTVIPKELVTLYEDTVVILTQIADQALSNGTWTLLAFDNEQIDDGDLHDNVTDPSRITAKETGAHTVSATVKTDEANNGDANIAISIDGVRTLFSTVDTGTTVDGWSKNISQEIFLNVDQYVEVWVLVNNAGKFTKKDNTFFSLRKD